MAFAHPLRGEAPSSIAVIYPNLNSSYRAIFNDIVKGIEEKSQGSFASYPINSAMDTRSLSDQLKRRNTAAVIVLGRQGLQFLPNLERTLPVIAGGLFSIPESEQRIISGISLMPEPGLLFTRLKTLLPKTRKVNVIYNAKNNEWLIKLAREAAQAHGLTLVTYEASDLPSAARIYTTVLQNMNNQHDALWLLQDTSTLDEDTILSLILKESWNRSLPVFSSSLVHVKKGLLFALYPNNIRMGHALANLALGSLTAPALKPGLVPLKEVDSAINQRMADHLDIEMRLQPYFDIVFAER